MITSVPANAHDSIFCIQVVQHAVHAGMAGKTGIIISSWKNSFIHVPFTMVISQRKYLALYKSLWYSMITATGQPHEFNNRQASGEVI